MTKRIKLTIKETR